ncbi:MAG: hypothetical protein ACREPY_09605 [Rhodanobacteraceae bacterium]
MKLFHASLIACAIAAFTGPALAASGSLVEFKPEVMPVVVQVNAQGQVTNILPSEQLTPWLRKLLIKQLNAWIVKPATVKGHAVGSRFIIEVAMRTTPRTDGKYDASFVYVKSLPMPVGGAAHWNVINGGLEFALVPDEAGSGSVHRVQYFRGEPRRWCNQTHSSQSMAHAASRPQPAAVAARAMTTMPAAMPVRSNFSARAAARPPGTPRIERR